MCPWSCSQINKYPSFSRYSYDPKYPLLLHHLYTTHVWPVVCSISVAFALLLYYLLPFPDPHTCGHVHTHIHTLPLKKKKKDIPQIWPDDPIMKQCTIFQAWVWGGTFQGIWGRRCFFLSELYYGVAPVFCLRGPVGATKETRHTTRAGNQSSVTWSRV